IKVHGVILVTVPHCTRRVVQAGIGVGYVSGSCARQSRLGTILRRVDSSSRRGGQHGDILDSRAPSSRTARWLDSYSVRRFAHQSAQFSTRSPLTPWKSRVFLVTNRASCANAILAINRSPRRIFFFPFFGLSSVSK